MDSQISDNLKISWVETPLGRMRVVADETGVWLLEFVEQRGLQHPITRGRPAAAQQIAEELEGYFSGSLREFKTPLCPVGTPFQKRVWEALRAIPHAETRAYAEIACAIGAPSAFRAVAQANGANPLAIVVPCHRVINKNGALGGYNGGIEKKRWLLEHESKNNRPFRVGDVRC